MVGAASYGCRLIVIFDGTVIIADQGARAGAAADGAADNADVTDRAAALEGAEKADIAAACIRNR